MIKLRVGKGNREINSEREKERVRIEAIESERLAQ